jgi:predicted GNAT family acetyltransferase
MFLHENRPSGHINIGFFARICEFNFCDLKLMLKEATTIEPSLPLSLEKLAAHEAEYFTFGAAWTRTPCAWFLDSDQLPDYRDCNHALHLRDDGRGAEAVAREVAAHYRARGTPIAADVDEVAERQGIGAALRRLGITPVIGRRRLMRYPSHAPPWLPERGITIEIAPNDLHAAATREWVETVVSDEEDEEDRRRWRAVTELEARFSSCRLYLARIDGRMAGACDLFAAQGWGRIDSVVTRPDQRRRGVASALAARAVADSLALGHEVTYLFTDAGGAGEQVYTRLGFEIWATDVYRRHIRF